MKIERVSERGIECMVHNLAILLKCSNKKIGKVILQLFSPQQTIFSLQYEAVHYDSLFMMHNYFMNYV